MRAIPQEHLIILGAPTNTFNGYCVEVEVSPGNFEVRASPAPTTIAEISAYIDLPAFTHDKYWANFLYAAVKMVETRRLRPQPGDILTLAVFMPALASRDIADWRASPHNPIHRNSVWVRGKFPYDPTVQQDQQGRQGRDGAKLSQGIKQPPGPIAPTTEPQIDHDILMRSTDENEFDGGYAKRSRRQGMEIENVHDVPFRLARGTAWFPLQFQGRPLDIPPLRNVLVKVLILREVEELFAYLRLGTWTGEYWRHWTDLHDENSPRTLDWTEASWIATAHPAAGHPDWNITPSVNRSRVKIRRLDYFGHSGSNLSTEDWMFLRYGWENPKGGSPPGSPPVGEVLLAASELRDELSADMFTPDAFAFMWGCHLGNAMGPMLRQFVKTAVACPSFTDYNHILDTPDSEVVPLDPVNDPFQRFNRP